MFSGEQGVLEGLDKVDWKNLSHAHGVASDVPGLIRDLASSNAEKRREARGRLGQNISHQGTVSPASAAAVPFLVELVDGIAVPEREHVLMLLARLSRGRSTNNEEVVRATHEAVARGTSVFLEALADANPRLRNAAAFLLATLPEKRSEILPELRKRISRDLDEQARASAIMALGILGEPSDEAALLSLVEPRAPELVRLAASFALASLTRGALPAAALAYLRYALDGNAVLERGWVEVPWASSPGDGGLVADVGACFALLGPERGHSEIGLLVAALARHARRPAAPALDVAKLLAEAEGDEAKTQELASRIFSAFSADGTFRRAAVADAIGRTLLVLAFGPPGKPRQGPLAEHQRVVLRALADQLEPAPVSVGTLSSVVNAYGFPVTAEELRKLAAT